MNGLVRKSVDLQFFYAVQKRKPTIVFKLKSWNNCSRVVAYIVVWYLFLCFLQLSFV